MKTSPIQDARIRNFLKKSEEVGDYPESRFLKDNSWFEASFLVFGDNKISKMKYSDEQIPSILQEFEEEDFIRLIDKGELPNSGRGQIED